MKNHGKKMVAPIIITVIFALYFIFYFSFLISFLSGAWKYVLVVIPLLCIAVIVYVCIERIKEIKKGEEDDISKY